jgi:hypothetical protein
MADAILDARDAALTGLLDDATMLPPSRSEAAAALHAHAARGRDGRGWLVGRFVVPVGALAEVHAELDHVDLGDRPLEVAVVLTRAGAGMFGGTVAKDLAAVQPLLEDDRVAVRGLELAIAGRAPGEELAALREAVDGAGVPEAVDVSVEVAVGDRAPGEVVRMLQAIAAVDGGRTVRAKARFGGIGSTPAPGDTELAGFLLACAGNRVAIRIGPGLTHPVRVGRRDGGDDHGILNVLAAAVVAYHGARLPRIEAALTTPAASVRLGSGAFIVGEEVVESEMLASCRSDFLLGIACVDPDEPLAGLVDLGVLGADGARA